MHKYLKHLSAYLLNQQDMPKDTGFLSKTCQESHSKQRLAALPATFFLQKA